MELVEEQTLLQTALQVSPLHDAELSWAFLVYCGLLETGARDEYLDALAECTPETLADALLDFASRRAELLDKRGALAARLWEYFQLGRSLQPEAETNPGDGDGGGGES